MARTDERLVVGGQVHALARNVTSEAETKRLYGSNWKTKFVNGKVLSFRFEASTDGGRGSYYITARYTFSPTTTKVKEINKRSVKKGLAPGSDAATAAAATTTTNQTTTANGTTTTNQRTTTTNNNNNTTNDADELLRLLEEDDDTTITDVSTADHVAECHGRRWWKVLPGQERITVSELPNVRRWHTFDAFGERLYQGCANGQRLSRLDVFLIMFPPAQMNDLVYFTNIQLEKKGESATT